MRIPGEVDVSDFHVAVVPVGKVAGDEVESALARAARILRQPFELKDALGVPPGVEDRQRGQFRAAELMAALRRSFARLGRGRMVGAEGEAGAAPPRPDAILFVTDVDLYTANAEAVFAAILAPKKMGIVSLRRLREAFYRRRADPGKQRARLTKEIVRVVARLRKMPACTSPQCALAPSDMLADVDIKEEKLCRACSQRLFQGTIRL